MADTYGVIDIGSNTIRFAIYKHEKAGPFREVDNIKTVARLRNYLDDHDCLTEEGIEVLVNTIKSYQDIATYHNIKNVKGAATATIRRAKNQAEILKKIKEVVSFDIQVFSEYEEAYYGFLAVVNSMDIENGITIDIGGGSTEVTLFKNRTLKKYHSFPFGALSLKRRFVKGEMPTKQEREAIRSFLKEQFQSLDWLRDKRLPVIGIGGSARNMAQVHQAMITYPMGGLHQYEMNFSQIEDVFNHMKDLDFDQMRRVEGLSEDRADIIVPAIQVFREIYEISSASSFILSRKGLRDGIFYEELLKPHKLIAFPDVLEESLFELMFEYDMNVNSSLQRFKLAKKLLNQMNELGISDISVEELTLLRSASRVFYLGDYIDSESGSQHTFYVLANRTIDGLNHIDRLKLALVASYKSKAVFKQYLETYDHIITNEEQRNLRLLGATLKVAAALNETKREIVKNLRTELHEGTLHIHVTHEGQITAEAYATSKQKKHLEKVLKLPVTFHFHPKSKV
nr:Ppx/GppA family phosphatase [Bacillus solimangrovi]